MASELAAADYEYHLPDHWVAHAQVPHSQFARLHSYYVGRVVDLIKESGAKTVLEVGCGDGWNVGQMVEQGLEVVGCDWSVNGIAYARLLVPGARFHQGDVRDPDFNAEFGGKFDAVALIEVIEHIPPKDAVDALRNIVSPLKQGGTFVLTTPSVNLVNDNPQHYRHFTEELLREIITEVGGLTLDSVEGYGDVDEERAYWRKARLVDNSLFTIKPLARRLSARRRIEVKSPMDRCHGLILKATKR